MTKGIRVRFFWGICVVLLVWLPMAGAAEPWAHKAPEHWTSEDVQHILTDSPWAKQGSANFPQILEHDESPGSAQADPTAAGVGSRAGMPLPGGQVGRWDGGVGRDPGRLPTLPVLVRWDSALPVRQALVRSGQADESLARSATDYIITIVGLWPGEKPKSAEPADDAAWSADPSDIPTEHEKPAPQGLGRMREALMGSAKLLPKGRKPVAPEDVTLDAKTGAIHLFFPRADPITLSDGEVVVSVQFGSMHVVEKFRLKDMKGKGKLEL
jgi:hypothetical protein